MKKKAGGLIRTVLIALAASLVLGLNLYTFSARMLNRDPMPMPFGVGVSIILSGSMEPALSTGDLIVVGRAEEYAERDIVVFQSGNSAVIHRIIQMDEETVITKGDANNADDGAIPKSAIKGKLLFSIPLLGYAVSFLQSPIGTVLVLGLAFFLLERSFRKEKAEHREKLEMIRREIDRLKEEQNKQ